jgi:hypothetical protein
MSSSNRSNVPDSEHVERSDSMQACSSPRPGNSPILHAIQQYSISPQASLNQDQEEMLRDIGAWSFIGFASKSQECTPNGEAISYKSYRKAS